MMEEVIPFVGNPQITDDVPPVFVYHQDFRGEILAMHQAITELNFWDKIRDGKHELFDGYLLRPDDVNSMIEKHKKVMECGHSGATFSYCFCLMIDIAINGWEKFAEKALEEGLWNEVLGKI